MQRTELSSLGEFGLIERLTGRMEMQQPGTIKGPGDDAAVIAFGEQVLLVTTDMMLEGIHFDLTYVPLKHLGYKAIAVNISDICAMNGTPRQVTVSLGLSNRFPLEAVEELYEGMRTCARIYGVDIIGGDTVSSQSGLCISITALGTAAPGDVVYRSGACEHDLIVVSGDLGAAYMGLQLLEREKAVWKSAPGVQPDLEGHDYILERQLKPEPRTDVVQLLAALGVRPTSMIDVSDGLASDLMHICRQSAKGCHIYEEKLPLDPTTITTAEAFHLDPTTCALHGGEDYELLFTIATTDYDKVKGNPHLTVIGHMTAEGPPSIVARDGSPHPLKAQGWDAFAERQA
jgi:thiamine-monophosphate kinase